MDSQQQEMMPFSNNHSRSSHSRSAVRNVSGHDGDLAFRYRAIRHSNRRWMANGRQSLPFTYTDFQVIVNIYLFRIDELL
jgi:hypothetical protein